MGVFLVVPVLAYLLVWIAGFVGMDYLVVVLLVRLVGNQPWGMLLGWWDKLFF